jgi:recombination protein RecA
MVAMKTSAMTHPVPELSDTSARGGREVRRLPWAGEPRPETLGEALPAGRLLELSGDARHARLTMAVSLLKKAQRDGETTAWVAYRDAPLFPPDFARAGVDLERLIFVQVPRTAAPYGPPKAAEMLLRSGALGWVFLDLSDSIFRSQDNAWQGRLLGLAREHESRVVMLTPLTTASLGPLVSMRILPERLRLQDRNSVLHPHVLKDKSGLLRQLAHEPISNSVR